jgi:SnoaL-like protein
VPWLPELFSGPALERIFNQAAADARAAAPVPYFAGVTSGETEALVRSFAGEPERVYYGAWPLTGRHARRPPLLQPDPDLQAPDVVGEYQRALAAGDVEAALAAFESDGYVREPAGGAYVHRGRDELVALYELFFPNGGGIPLEHCAVTDDGRSCALEYKGIYDAALMALRMEIADMPRPITPMDAQMASISEDS